MSSKGCYILALLLSIATGVAAQPAPGVLAEVDSLRMAGQFEAALVRLDALNTETPGHAEILWRRARTKVSAGERASSRAAQRRHYEAALADAEAAVAADPQHPEAHVAHAIAAGRMGLISGTKEKIAYSREVKEGADRAIALDDQNGPAYHIRARWHYEVASLGFLERTVLKVVYGGLPDASFEQAKADLERAIAIDDSVIVNHLELGKTYMKLDEEEQARQAFERVLGLPEREPEDGAYKQEARQLLRKL